VVTEATQGVYLDASALVKLVVTEAESDALRRFLSDGLHAFSSRVAVVEVHRAVQRQSEVDAGEQVEAVLAGIDVIELDESVALSAARVRPTALRSLDAVHLASAVAIGEELASFVTYDARLADAVREAGLTVATPA
jgi:predicted nucleic acid-binding protein